MGQASWNADGGEERTAGSEGKEGNAEKEFVDQSRSLLTPTTLLTAGFS